MLNIMDQNRWTEFKKRYSPAHYIFACHAAIPRIFTTDLLYKIWLNFQKNTEDEPLDIPLTAIADLINAPIVKELGNDLFEFYPDIRIALNRSLAEDSALGAARKQELAHFVQDYVRFNTNKIPSLVVKHALLLEAKSILDPVSTINDLIHNLQQNLDAKTTNTSGIKQTLNFIQGKKRSMPKGTATNVWQNAEDITNAILKNKQGETDEAIKILEGFKDKISQEGSDENAISIQFPEEILVGLGQKFKKKTEIATSLHALIIGINEHHPDAGISSLTGCVNDANNIKDFLTENYADRNPSINILLDEQATYENIIKGFQTIIKEAKAGQAVLFYFSGFGSRETTGEVFKAFNPEGYNETIVCYDSRIEGHYDFADKEFLLLLSQINQETNITVIIDTCYVVIPQREEVRPIDTYLPDIKGNYVEILKKESAIMTLPQPKHIVLEACEKWQVARETKEGGVFTTALLNVLKKNININYKNLFDETNIAMSTRAENQTPVLMYEDFDIEIEFLSKSIKDKKQSLKNKDTLFKNQQLTFKAHPSFTADVQLITLDSNVDNNYSTYTSYRKTFESKEYELLDLNTAKIGSNTDKTIIELSNIFNETSLERQPLAIDLPYKSNPKEFFIPVALQDGFMIPIGRVEKSNWDVLNIKVYQLPILEDIASSENHQKTIRFCLLKVNSLEKPAINQLKIFKNNQLINVDKAEIRKAKKILLIIPGIAPDTRYMAQKLMPFVNVNNETKYDILLTFDYNNFDESIEYIAKDLHHKLLEIGLNENDGKQLDIVAHSIGGLVARQFIEKEREGDHLVDRLIMLGTPNGGLYSKGLGEHIALMTDMLSIALNFSKNTISSIASYSYRLINRRFLSEEVNLNLILDQVSTGSPSMKYLKNNMHDIDTEYFAIAGGASDSGQIDKINYSGFLKQVLREGRKIFKNIPRRSDFIVSEGNVFSISSDKFKIPTYPVICHHLDYFNNDAMTTINSILKAPLKGKNYQKQVRIQQNRVALNNLRGSKEDSVAYQVAKILSHLQKDKVTDINLSNLHLGQAPKSIILKAIKEDAQIASLKNADLSYIDLERVNFKKIDLSKAKLKGVNLSGASLIGANLSGANLIGADLSNANLRDANLLNANLQNAYLISTDFTRANLKQANLSSANLKQATFSNTILTATILDQVNIQKSDWFSILKERNVVGIEELEKRYYIEAVSPMIKKSFSPQYVIKKGQKKTYDYPTTNHLLAIGIDTYSNGIPPLYNVVRDAKKLEVILSEKYNFKQKNIISLYDQEATKDNILDAFDHLAEKLTKDDNLIVFFSGHSELVLNQGYWIPVDARSNRRGSYLIDFEIQSFVSQCKAMHILIIADSEYSNTLLK